MKPTRVRFGLIILFVTSLSQLYPIRVAWAEGSWPYAKVSCNKKENILTVEELYSETREGIPHQAGVRDLTALTEIKSINGPAGLQDYQLPKDEFWFSCKLGVSHYKVKIEPWKFNQKINGICGGYSPSIQLTVWIGAKKLLDKFIFSGFCNSPDIPPVDSVIILDDKRMAVFRFNPEIINRGISFSELPAINRERISR